MATAMAAVALGRNAMRISASACPGAMLCNTSLTKKANRRSRAVWRCIAVSESCSLRAASIRIIAAAQPSVAWRNAAGCQSRPCKVTSCCVSVSVKRSDAASITASCWPASARAYAGAGGSRLMMIKRACTGSSASAAAMPVWRSGAGPSSCMLSSTNAQGSSSVSARRRRQRRIKPGTSRRSSALGRGRCKLRCGASRAAADRRKWTKVAGSASAASSCSQRQGTPRVSR